MLPDRVSNPGPLTYESGALPIALRGPAKCTLLVLDCHSCKDLQIQHQTNPLPQVHVVPLQSMISVASLGKTIFSIFFLLIYILAFFFADVLMCVTLIILNIGTDRQE